MAAGGLGYVGAGWFLVLFAALCGELVSVFFFLFAAVLTLWVFFWPAWNFDLALVLGLAALWNEGAQIEDRTGLLGRSQVSPDPSSGAIRRASAGALAGLVAGVALWWLVGGRPAVPVLAAFLGAVLVAGFEARDLRRGLATGFVVLESGNGGRFLKLLLGVVMLACVVLTTGTH